MPLVFAVAIILVIFFNAKDSKLRNDNISAEYTKSMRRTNAVLEQQIMDSYMKQGLSADDAFRKSYEDIIAAGYEPCIPRGAYYKNSSFCKSRVDKWEYGRPFDPRAHDSFAVQERRKDIEEEWKKAHPGESVSDHLEEIDNLVYQNFPRNEAEYNLDIKRRSNRAQAEPIGTFVIYPGLGTCEVLAHNWIGNGTFGGYYSLKVLKTGKIVNYVKIGDNKIRTQD